MKYLRSRIRSSADILSSYNYPQPFHLHLKQCFKANKKFGSKDRKAISNLCYSYYRIRRILKTDNVEMCLLLSAYVLLDVESALISETASEMGLSIHLDNNITTRKDKLRSLDAVIHQTKDVIFNTEYLSSAFHNIDQFNYADMQPYLWFKYAPNNQGAELHPIAQKSAFLPTAFFLEKHIEIDENVFQIQDLSSQYICSKINISKNAKVWDCCSGAGGKSLSVYRPDINLFLSDKRASIIQNAKSRFTRYGISNINFSVIDLHQESSEWKFNDALSINNLFDVVLVDAPCSGSGTWMRTPEHISLFDYSKVEEYAINQKHILKAIRHTVRDNGLVYYLTCSMFSQENEEVVAYAEESLGYQLVDTIFFNGVDHKSDFMFMAILKLKEQ